MTWRALFISPWLKTPAGEESYNPNGLAQRAISLLKDTFPDLAGSWEQALNRR